MKANLRHTGRARAAALTLVSVAAITGCSSAEDKVYDAYKCSRIAAIVGQADKARAAAAKGEPYMKDLKTSGSWFEMRLMTRFTDDLELHRLSPVGQVKKLQGTFESGICQKLYE